MGSIEDRGHRIGRDIPVAGKPEDLVQLFGKLQFSILQKISPGSDLRERHRLAAELEALFGCLTRGRKRDEKISRRQTGDSVFADSLGDFDAMLRQDLGAECDFVSAIAELRLETGTEDRQGRGYDIEIG